MNRIDLMKEIEAAIKNAETADWWGFDHKAAMAEIDQGLCLAKVEEAGEQVAVETPATDYSSVAVAMITDEMQAIVVEMVPPVVSVVGKEAAAKPEAAVNADEGILEALMNGSKAATIDRTRKIFAEILKQRPETFHGIKEITNAVYEAEAGKKAEGSFFRTINARFTAAGLVEWSGKAKDQIFWK